MVFCKQGVGEVQMVRARHGELQGEYCSLFVSVSEDHLHQALEKLQGAESASRRPVATDCRQGPD